MIEYKKKYPEKVQHLLKRLVDEFQKDDYTVRQSQIRTWRQLKLLWENFQSNYSDVAHDWRIPMNANNQQFDDQGYYDRPINVFRAYLESIIAALSVTIPGIKCYPEDAESSLDNDTAKAGDKAGKRIYRDNDVSLLWLHALFVYCTEGMVAGYNRLESSPDFGQYTENEYEDKLETHHAYSCPECGYMMQDNLVDNNSAGIEPPLIDPDYCESCGQFVQPIGEENSFQVNELIDSTLVDKKRVCLDAMGGLYVKIPNWARNQAECPYLFYSYETHYVNALDMYPHLRGEIDCGIFDPYEVWGRLSPQYRNEYPSNQVTCRHVWFRPASYNIFKDDEIALLQKHFPDGVRCDLINDTYAGAESAKLDDDWTITINPMSDYVHADPIGMLLISVQSMTNDLVSLTLQTIEHGIGQTFADPQVLDFKGYKQLETAPGQIFPAKPKAGKSLADGFFEVKTATLSQEVMPFGQEVQNLGQLVSGALPSLFGGAMEEQKTASGYAMSRAQALQRLQNTWKMFTIWWKTIFSKAIPKYLSTIAEDEKDVLKTNDGGFLNDWIRLSQLDGKIGRYELEANENLPLTWSQRKDVIMELIQINNPEILTALWAPENRHLLKEAIGLDDFNIPGEQDVQYYYEVIRELLNGVPMPMGVDMMGMPTEGPSVEVIPELENTEIAVEILRSWIRSDAGKLAKTENPDGYKNVLLYGQEILALQQQQMMAQAQAEMMASSDNGASGGPNKGNGSNPKKPKETDKQAPIESEADVRTI